MRLMVEMAEFVCSVAKVRWPVSAMRSADSMVSRGVAHFTDQNNVGVFAERSSQGIREGVRIRMHFALIHQASFVIVQKFDRVFDRNHVLFTFAVDLVEHGRKRRRFSRAGGTSDQHQATRLVATTSSR